MDLEVLSLAPSMETVLHCMTSPGCRTKAALAFQPVLYTLTGEVHAVPNSSSGETFRLLETRGVARLLECLPSIVEALGSIFSN